MDKKDLEIFIEKFDNFSSLGGTTQVDYFAYFLTADKEIENFTSKQIEECFNILSIKFYKRTSTYLSENSNKRNGKYIKSKIGYKLERNRFQEIKKVLTDKEQQIQNLDLKEIRKAGALIIVNKKATYSFDVFLRDIFKKAESRIFIADSYVDDTLIDNYLNTIPSNIITKILYGTDYGSFVARANKYKIQYSKFEYLQYKYLHDRFIIVDDVGYVLGPSIKDAAINSPALVIGLNSHESALLIKFFMELWNISK